MTLLALVLSCIFVFFSGFSLDRGEETEPSTEATVAAQTGEDERFPSVPEDLKGHFLLQKRGFGPCGELEGGMHVTLVFVDDAESRWTQEQMLNYRTRMGDALNRIAAKAWEREVLLTIVIDQKHCAIEASVDSSTASSHVSAMLEKAGIIRAGEQSPVNYPVVFAFNKEGRAFASSMGSWLEYSVLFDDPMPLRHELYHLFGAADYYYHPELKAQAERWLGETTMLDSTVETVDDLTAYLVGWTDELSHNALSFLRVTSYIDEASLEASRNENTFTGKGTKYYENGSVYTGDIVLGVPQGWGVLRYYDGSVYEGEFYAGLPHGTGTYTWTSGVVYYGDYDQGKQTGYATLTWPDGASYTGGILEGQFHGRGVYRWADGSVYDGDYVNGQRTGSGTMTWASGAVYKGEFLNGKLHGKGTLTYPDGTVQSGTWDQDQFMG